MKRILFSLAIITVGLLIGCNPNYEKAQIKDVVTDVKGTLIEFNTDNVKSIGAGIKRNINIMDNLIKEIDNTKDYEKAFPHIVSSVDELAKSYQNISSKKELIRKTLQNKVNDVKTQRELTKGKIAFVKQKIAKTEMALANERTDYRKVALETTLKFEKQELEVWERFATGVQFNEMIAKLEDASGGINKFIDILDANTMVYTQAAITLHAVQDYKRAKQDLAEVIAVIDMGNELVESWSKLSVVIDGAMAHMDEIEAINFDSPLPTKSTTDTDPVEVDSTKGGN